MWNLARICGYKSQKNIPPKEMMIEKEFSNFRVEFSQDLWLQIPAKIFHPKRWWLRKNFQISMFGWLDFVINFRQYFVVK